MEIKEIEEKLALMIRKNTPVEKMPIVLGECYAEIIQYVNEIGAKEPIESFVIYYNMDMSSLEIDVGFTVSEKLPGRDHIRLSSIPAGKYAVALHEGPYDTLSDTYNELTAFVKEKEFKVDNWVYEVYLNNPMENPNEPPRTMIYFPLK
ncbi:MAG: hydrolase [Promethearchaeota archaeon]|jgi:effector-binding domain-containing protein